MRRFAPAWLAVLLSSVPILAAEEAAHEPETFLGLPNFNIIREYDRCC